MRKPTITRRDCLQHRQGRTFKDFFSSNHPQGTKRSRQAAAGPSLGSRLPERLLVGGRRAA